MIPWNSINVHNGVYAQIQTPSDFLIRNIRQFPIEAKDTAYVHIYDFFKQAEAQIHMNL